MGKLDKEENNSKGKIFGCFKDVENKGIEF